MTAVKTKIGAGGRIVLPASCRAELGVRPGDEVMLHLENGEIRINTMAQAIRRFQAFTRRHIPGDASLADELIAERRAEARRDAAEDLRRKKTYGRKHRS